MANEDTIAKTAERLRAELKGLGAEAQSTAIAIVVAKLCADGGLSLTDVVGMLEAAHRAELLRASAA